MNDKQVDALASDWVRVSYSDELTGTFATNRSWKQDYENSQDE